jgi:AraC family transcriptional regulator
LDHEQRIEEAIGYIVANLDEPIDLRDLADHVCLSRFHFHRVFQALMGETVGDIVRRLRLERAAIRLRTSDTPITELAFEAGYATHEAFIRAFRAAFGCTPLCRDTCGRATHGTLYSRDNGVLIVTG